MPAIRTEGPSCDIGANPFTTASQPIAGKDWASPARLHVFSVHLQPHDILCLPAFLAFDQAVFDLLALRQ